MSDTVAAPAPAPAPAAVHRLTTDEMLALLNARVPVEQDPSDHWDLTVVVPSERLREALLFLRDSPRFQMNMLVDIAGVDYLSYPNHRQARFAVVYLLKSVAFNHRIKLKVWIEEDHPEVPSIHDLFKIADWSERECWDQVGIFFAGHPNLKRLLNHHEFVGHPLRKDYPCQKRQKLNMNDPMVDQLELRLRQLGYTVVDTGELRVPSWKQRPLPGGADPATGDPGQGDPDLTSAVDGQKPEEKRGYL